ncbi:hypothetical protein Tco_1469193 [Tanacetum coccineum]
MSGLAPLPHPRQKARGKKISSKGCPRNASESNGGLDGNVLKLEVELLGASAERLHSDGEDFEKEISTQSEGEYRLGVIGSNSDPYWKFEVFVSF